MQNGKHMPLYNQLIDDVIKREGGFVDHPADRGGPTKYGITQKTLTLYLARETSVTDVENLSRQTAIDIYYAYYWIKPRVNELPELIQPITFDMIVNSGKRGTQILQNALINSGYDCGKIDGRIGDKTVASAKQACADLGNELIRKIVRRRVIFYEGLVKNNDSQRVFLAGWINRAESFLPAA